LKRYLREDVDASAVAADALPVIVLDVLEEALLELEEATGTVTFACARLPLSDCRKTTVISVPPSIVVKRKCRCICDVLAINP